MKSAAKQCTTARFLGSLLKSARYVMRKDGGLNGDLDWLPMPTGSCLNSLEDRELQRAEAALARKKFESSIRDKAKVVGV